MSATLGDTAIDWNENSIHDVIHDETDPFSMCVIVHIPIIPL